LVTEASIYIKKETLHTLDTGEKMSLEKLLDPQLRPILDAPSVGLITRDNLQEIRDLLQNMQAALATPSTTGCLSRRKIPGRDEDLDLYIFQPENVPKNNPALLWMHGGGYILPGAIDLRAPLFAEQVLCTVISVDYRIAPEHPYPAGPEDCYSALLWVVENATELGIDPDRLAIGGQSSGAGMAASVALMNRDRKGPKLAFQYLLYPMLDNLHDTPSAHVDDHAVWNRQTSLNAWEMYLNGTPGLDASPYASASRATDLSKLPPCFLTVGALDLFRDECIEYAQRLMLANVPTQLEVFPGMPHAGELMIPDAVVSQRMQKSYLQALHDGLMQRY
jgi:acetyl esterase